MLRRDFFKRVLGGVTAAFLAPSLPLLEPDPTACRLHVITDGAYSFGFTGFKPAGDGQIEGQILFSGNMVVQAPRTSRLLYGITE